MSKTRGFIARIFARIGGSIFALLTGLEERGILPGAARWFKLSILGLVVALVSAPLKAADDDIILCYVPIEEPHILISDVSAEPNPTAGVDTVIVKATAMLGPQYKYEGDSAISEAFMQLSGATGDTGINGDTLHYPMKALDGKFGDTLETLEARLYVGDREPETTWIYIVVKTNTGNAESAWKQLVISAPAPDSIDKKEDKND